MGLPGAEPIRVMRQAVHHPQRQHISTQPTHAVSHEGAGER